MKTPTGTDTHGSFESVAGLWKFALAVAILVGHNLVTVNQWYPDNVLGNVAFRALQFFSPYQFFLFSGYFAAASLLDSQRSMGTLIRVRLTRVYIIILAALAWGLTARLIAEQFLDTSMLGTIWPLDSWNGPIDWKQVALHLNPFGFADHLQFNYAVWYLYQETRIALLFPLLRWILHRPTQVARWGAVALILAIASILEFFCWSWFPLFRSSPMITLAYSAYFLAGSLVWMELRAGGLFSRIPRVALWPILGIGIGIAFLDAIGVRPPVNNPPILLLPTLVGQILVFASLRRLLGNFGMPSFLKKACDLSVGIYVVHPPIHIFAAWWAIRTGSFLPLLIGIALSLAMSIPFHHLVERPTSRLFARKGGRADDARQRPFPPDRDGKSPQQDLPNLP